MAAGLLAGVFACGLGLAGAAEPDTRVDVLTTAEGEEFFQGYFDRMNAPKPLARFRTREEWVAYRAELREKTLRAIGLSPLPERVPLEPKVTGRLEHEDYTVERVFYQVLPGAYASAYLYVPKRETQSAASPTPARVRFPAVLNPHGHWAQGAVDPVVQARCIALAKKGYVALCPESTHVADLAIGLCPIGLMTWNNVRALDYLESLDFVDASRLGCTGESGGGQQTLYLAALDERVKVIVPAVLVSYFRRILFVGEDVHCFCNHAPGIAAITDEPELAALFAPRPTRFICATGDWTKDFPQNEFPDIRHIFDLVGGAVDCVQFDKPHNYDRDSREQMYAWMNRHLKDETDPSAAVEPSLVTEEPERLRTLGARPPEFNGLEGAPAYFRSRFAYRQPVLSGRSAWRAYLHDLRARLGGLLGEEIPATKLDVKTRGWAEVQGLSAEKLRIETEPAVAVPAWLFRPVARAKRAPAVVLVHPEGKRALMEKRLPLVRACLDRGWLVMAMDPRMRGELQRRWFWNQVIWGRPEEGMAAHDLNAARRFLGSRADVDPGRVFVVGLGDLGRAALHAAALDSHWAGVAVEDVGPLYADMCVTNVLPNVLRHGDLPQFAALTAPRPLWLNRTRGRFEFTARAFAALGGAARLRCTDSSDHEFDAGLPEWLARVGSSPTPARRWNQPAEPPNRLSSPPRR